MELQIELIPIQNEFLLCSSFSENAIENASNDSSALLIGTLNLKISFSELYLYAPQILVALFMIKVISSLSGIVNKV